MNRLPDELGLRMDVSNAILGQVLVHAVKERPQKAPHHTHQDKEGQVHCCPQVAVLVSIGTLSSKGFCKRNEITLISC